MAVTRESRAQSEPVSLPAPERSARRSGILRRTWELALRWIVYAAELLIVVAITGELTAVIAGIVSRDLFDASLPWTDDLGTICLNLIAFLGGAVAIQRGRGMSLDLVVDRIPARLSEPVRAGASWIALIYLVILWKTVPDFLLHAQQNRTANLDLPTTFSAMWVPVGSALLILFLVDGLRRLKGTAVLLGLAGAIVVSGIVWGVTSLNNAGVLAVSPLVGLGIVFGLTLLAGLPIALVIGAAAFAFIQMDGTVPLATVPIGEQSGISSFVLLAIPFFMLAGVLMDQGGLAGKLIDMITPVVRRLPAGMLITQVLAVCVFSGISGSKTADIAAIGSAMRTPLKEAGYEPAESTAVLAGSAAISETIPPSLAIIILASITTLSPGALFLGGLLPAAMMALVLIVGIWIRGRSAGFPKPTPASFREFARAFPRAIPALILPVILVWGIVGGVGTATEVAAVAALYGLIVVGFSRRSLRGRTLVRSAVDASVMGGMVLFIIANATVLSQAITINQIPQRLAAWLGSLGGSAVFMMLSVATLVALGALLEGLPAIVVFAPLLVPVAEDLGVSPLQYGIVLIIAMGIGSFSPPIGAGLFVAATIGDSPVGKVMKPAFLYTGIMLVGVIVVAFWPALTTFVPSLFGK